MSQAATLDLDLNDELETNECNSRLILRRSNLADELAHLEHRNRLLCDAILNHLDTEKRHVGSSRFLYNAYLKPKMHLPQLKNASEVSASEKLEILSVLIRYLCIANQQCRNTLKRKYFKQSELYLQAQGLSIPEIHEHLHAIKNPDLANDTHTPVLDQIFARYPDPNMLSETYEMYHRLKYPMLRAPKKKKKSEMNPSDEGSSPVSPYSPVAGSTRATYSRALEDKPSSVTGKKKNSMFGRATISMWGSKKKNSDKREPIVVTGFTRMNAPSVASVRKEAPLTGGRLIRFDPKAKQMSSCRERSDVATVTASLQNTHHLYAKVKARLPEINTDPFAPEHNFGFDIRYSRGMVYPFDDSYQFYDAAQMLQMQRERNGDKEGESSGLSPPVTPSMGPMTPSLRPLPSPSFAQSLPSANPTHSKASSAYSLNTTRLLSPTSATPQTPKINFFRTTLGLNSGNSPTEEVADLSLEPRHSYEDSVATSVSVGSTQSGGSRNTASREMRPKKDKFGAVQWYTLPQFVESATGTTHNNTSQILILTHRLFCNSSELLETLRQRYLTPIMPNLTPTEVHHFKSHYVQQVRIRVTAVLQHWMNKHYEDDFADDPHLVEQFRAFLEEINSGGGRTLAAHLNKQLTKKEAEDKVSKNIAKRKSNILPHGGGTKRGPKVLDLLMDTATLDILNFPIDKIADCVISLAFGVFSQIGPREVFAFIKKKNIQRDARHMQEMIAQFNALVNWVQREILHPKRGDIKQRVACISHFVRLSQHLVEKGNFSSSYAILTAINSMAIHRLKRSRAKLAANENKILKDLKDLFSASHNYPALRERMKRYLAKPCIPHVGLFTRDLTMLSEQPSTKHDGNLINFSKAKQCAKQIDRMRMFQNNKFELNCDQMLLRYIRGELDEEPKSDDELWNLSEKLEPKIKPV